MNQTSTVPAHLPSLNELFGMATATASHALERWTNGAVTLSLEELHEAPLEEAAAQLGVSEERTVVILLSIAGELTGDFVLCFGEQDGRLLCSAVTGMPTSEGEEWSELDQSALLETGNILGSAYLNALTAHLGQQLVPTPPQFVLDYGASVVEQVLLPHGMLADLVFVARTTFRHGAGRSLDAQVLFVPGPALRDVMDQAISSH
ncbi:MAG: chemotaxis protein [Pirellulales bacterium]|nr:chemotaxis protein [Pirellulales bacterium]